MSFSTDKVTGLKVLDEGLTVVNPANSMDFVGAGVIASNGGGGKATVTIAGGSGAVEVTNEVIHDNGDGTYTLANTPTAGSLHVYKNGVSMQPSIDYTLSGAVVTSLAAYDATDIFTADYFH